MQYDVVRNERLTGLVNYINTFIRDGWQPLGGLAISANEKYGIEYHQAIVKYNSVVETTLEVDALDEFAEGKE